MTDDAMRAMHQQFTATLEGLARQNAELQNELAESRQRAANELAALRQEVRGAPLRGTQATGVGVDTRLLGKPSGFSRAQDTWRNWSTVLGLVRLNRLLRLYPPPRHVEFLVSQMGGIFSFFARTHILFGAIFVHPLFPVFGKMGHFVSVVTFDLPKCQTIITVRVV